MRPETGRDKLRFHSRSMGFRPRRKHRESDRKTSPNLVDRMAVRKGVSNADVEGQVLLYLPDQSDQAGHRFRFAKFLLVKDLRHRTHRPLRRPLDDHACKEIGALFTSQLCDSVQVNGSPVPALRYDTGDTRAKLGRPAAVGQQHAELSCNAKTVFLLKTTL